MKKRLILVLIFSATLTYGQIPDKGIGVAFLEQSLPTNDNPKNDTMKIYLDKNLTSTIARFIFNPRDRFDNRILSKSKITSKSLFEFEYETYGFPITQVDTLSGTIEVIYGYENSIPLKGWITQNKANKNYYLWSQYLKENYLYFPLNQNFKFYGSPNGKEIQINIIRDNENKLDYIMKPIKVNKEWMQVKLVSPSDYGREPVKKQETTCWIKFLSSTGRPLVWYYPRD
jgi:hypothetical protein